MTIALLPLASVSAQDWGQLASVFASQQAAQEHANASQRNGALTVAIVAVLLLSVAVRVLTRAQKPLGKGPGRL